ncbi:MAG: PAS domain S-box protein, partial [Melioribacteraceae bacterium]
MKNDLTHSDELLLQFNTARMFLAEEEEEEEEEARIVVSLLDVTERKQAEESLHQAEENYRGIFENAVEGIYQSTPEGLFLSVNPAMVRIFGYETPEHMVASISNIAQQFYVEPTTRLALIRALKETGVVLDLVYQAYRKDGSIIWVTENARGVRDTNGVLLFFEGFIEDITERKQAEEELKISHKTYLGIINSLTEAIYIQDENGVFLEVNKTAEKF